MKHEKSIKIILLKNRDGRKKYIIEKYLDYARKKNDLEEVNEKTLNKLKKEKVNFIQC